MFRPIDKVATTTAARPGLGMWALEHCLRAMPSTRSEPTFSSTLRHHFRARDEHMAEALLHSRPKRRKVRLNWTLTQRRISP